MFRKMFVLVLLTAILGCQPVLGSITETSNRESLFTGDGGTAGFVFSFPIDTGSSGSHADLEVHLITTATGNSVEQTETTHYSVSATNNNFSSGGTVTMVTAPAATEMLLLIRDTPQTQEASIGASGVRRTIQDALDKLTKQIIDLQEESNRSLKFPVSDSTSITAELADSVSRASTALGFTSTGAPVAISSFTPGTVAVDVFMEDYLAKSNANAANTFMGLGTTDSPTWVGGTFTGAVTVGTTLGVTGATTLTGGIAGDLDITGDVGMATAKTLTVETIIAVDGDGLSLHEDGGTGILIEDGGLVGIGVTDPDYALDIWSTGVTTIRLMSDSDDNSADQDASILFQEDGTETTVASIRYDEGLAGLSMGSFSTADIFILSSTGFVGIGDTTPSYLLAVNEDIVGFTARFLNDGNNANRQVLNLTGGPDDGATGNWDVVGILDGNADSIGGIRHPTGGGALAFFDVSDERLKENVRDTQIKGVDVIRSLKVRDFEWTENGATVTGGFSAQEVYAVCPAAAVPPEPGNPDSLWTMSQGQFIPYLVKAVQELEAKIKVLEAAP